MVATSYRYIVQKAGVRSGHAVVEGTRIGVHDVVAMAKAGASVDEIVGSTSDRSAESGKRIPGRARAFETGALLSDLANYWKGKADQDRNHFSYRKEFKAP